MKLRLRAFLADENIHPQVIAHWQKAGLDIVSVKEIGLVGADDPTIIRKAYSENRVVLTHDSDFATLAILNGEPIVGIVYLRPGHISFCFTIETMETLFRESLEIETPFIIVAERTGNIVKIRLRKLDG